MAVPIPDLCYGRCQQIMESVIRSEQEVVHEIQLTGSGAGATSSMGTSTSAIVFVSVALCWRQFDRNEAAAAYCCDEKWFRVSLGPVCQRDATEIRQYCTSTSTRTSTVPYSSFHDASEKIDSQD